MFQRIIISVVLFCNSTFVFAQITTFQKTYPMFANAYGGGIEQTSDNGYITSGAYIDTVGTDTINPLIVEVVGLVKMDFAGNAQWIKSYNIGAQCAYGGSSTQTTDGGYVYTTVYTDSTGTNPELYLFKTDANGIPVWNRAYGGLGNEYSMGIVKSSDGGYCIVAYSDSHTAGNGDYYLVKVSSTGILQWAYTYDMNSAYEFPMSIYRTSDNGYVVVGSVTDTSSTTNVFPQTLVLKVDSLGNINWAKKYTNLAFFCQPYNIKQTNDNGYIITGQNYDSTYTSVNTYLIKLNSLGNVIWSKIYGGNGTYYGDGGLSVQQTTDNGYAVAISTTDSLGGYKCGIMKTDALGNPEWTRVYGGAINSMASSIEKSNDGGYCMVAANFSNYNIYVIKTDDNGLSGCYDSTINRTGTNFPLTTTSGMVRDTVGVMNAFPMTYSPIPSGDNVICESISTPPIAAPPSLTEVSIFIPNVFTPNGDGENDNFNISTIGVSDLNCIIYNRWGNKIYEIKSVNGQWNGQNDKGLEVSDGVYYYVLSARDVNAKELHQAGFITKLK